TRWVTPLGQDDTFREFGHGRRLLGALNNVISTSNSLTEMWWAAASAASSTRITALLNCRQPCHARNSASVRYASCELVLDTRRSGQLGMVGINRISAVLVSTDLERSQAFYQDKVGLTLSPETIKNHLVFDCGSGTSLLIYGRGSGNKADHTQVRFRSTDIGKDVAELVGRGVEFE